MRKPRIPLTPQERARLDSFHVFPGTNPNVDPRAILQQVDRVMEQIAGGDFEIVDLVD